MNKEDKRIFTLSEEKPVKAVVKMGVPLIAGMFIMVLYNLVDTYFIGLMHDDYQLAAVNLAYPVMMITIAVSNMIGTGSSSLIARSLGADDREKANHTLTVGFMLTVINSMIVAAVGLIFLQSIVQGLGAKDNTTIYTEQYVRIILLGSLPCVVIGVLEKQESPFGGQDNLEVYIPYTSAIARITGSRYLSSITVKVKDGWSNAVAEQLITNFLTIRHGAKDVFTNSSDTILKTIQKTTGTMTLLVSCIAVISLIVGGIGVMNIMLVSVTERTKEIGIRMAVGARKSDILQQFLIEAILVCLIGGFLGIMCSYGVSIIFSLFVQSMSMVFSPLSIVAAVTCSTLIGVVFGYIPAKNAAKLDPIDALARE